MRRMAGVLAVCLILCALVFPAMAATSASRVQNFVTVSGDGSCQVSLTVQLHLDAPVSELHFPLPEEARAVSVNGSSARTSTSGGLTWVNLSRLVGDVAGDFPVNITYTLSNLVKLNDQDVPELTVPLLSGFSYPVESMEFTIALPATIENKPVFSSGYFQQSIESNITYEVRGNTVSGSITQPLKDQETLVMILTVTEEMFPNAVLRQWATDLDLYGMITMGVLAVLYWAVFLRCLPPRRLRCTAPPEGFTAGQLGSVLANQGCDLTMMVFTWARLGYILIHLQDHGRVILHKRMEMGNERSGYEQRLFRKLFGKRRQVDGTGYHYAQLCQLAAVTPGDLRDLFHRRSGNPRVLRILCAGVGFFAGISLANAMSGRAVIATLLSVIFCLLCALFSWLIQDWAAGLHLRNRGKLWLALGCAGLWLLIAALAGDIVTSAIVVAAQLLGGLASAYGGRRTEAGRQLMSEVLGLRSYLRTVPPPQLQRLHRFDPDYFFAMAPSALALGVGSQFAKRFGKRKLGSCPYLTTGMDGHRTATEWYQLMRQAAEALDHRQKRLLLERLIAR